MNAQRYEWWTRTRSLGRGDFVYRRIVLKIGGVHATILAAGYLLLDYHLYRIGFFRDERGIDHPECAFVAGIASTFFIFAASAMGFWLLGRGLWSFHERQYRRHLATSDPAID